MGRLKWIFLPVGVALLVWVIHRIGLEEILNNLRLLGWRLALTVLLFSPTYLLYTAAWQRILARSGASVPFRRLLKIKLTGEAANASTPINFAGGDPLRVWLLSGDVPAAIGGASAVVDRTLHLFAVLILIIGGTLYGIFRLDLPAKVIWILWGAVGLVTALTFFFLILQRQGLFDRLTRWSAGLQIRRFSKKTLANLRELDRQVVEFYAKSPRTFWECLALHLTARLFGILEILLLARLLHVPMNFGQALFFGSVIPMTIFLAAIVPGSMGILEGVVGGLFYVLHWSPADGVAMQVARRLRAGLWISLGFILFFFHRRKGVATHLKKD